MSWKARHLGIAAASLVAVAALAGATAAAAGPRVEKVKLGRQLGDPERILAYGRSQLLLVGPYEDRTIRRIDANGSLDRSFGDGGVVRMPFSGVTVAPGGKILVTGAHSPPNDPSNSDAFVTRLLPNGKPDPGFGSGGTAYVDFGGHFDRGATAAVTANGDVLLGGAKQSFRGDRGGSGAVPAIARLLPNGALDHSFGSDGSRILRGGSEGGVSDLAPLPDGGVVAEGEADIGTAVWKLSAEGALDRGFGQRGLVEIKGRGKRRGYGWEENVELVDQVEVLPSGKVLLAGTGSLERSQSSSYRAVALRLRRDGTIDRSYGERGWAIAKISGSTFVEGMALLPGKVLLLAASAQYSHDNRSDVGAIAFGPGGRPDPRFGKRGRFRVDISGFDLVEAVTALGGRAVILAEAGKGRGPWLVTMPPIG